MLNHTWKGKSPAITKPTLGNLKPAILHEDLGSESSFFSKIQQLEKLNSEQNEEICELRRLLHEEQSKNKNLEKQIQEMTDFLEDYGMHWVGGPRPQPAEYTNGPDHNLFLEKISELNNIADTGKIEFIRNGNITTLKQQKPVTIVLYDKGFTVNGSDVREYDKPCNQSFMNDILDGFFPQEFKETYPGGVIFKVEDNRSKNIKYPQLAQKNKNSKNSDLELLPPPTNIGNGDGAVKVRIPGIPDVVIRVSKDMKVSDLLLLIEDNFDIHKINLVSPCSNEVFDEESHLSEVGLYPRGFAFVVYK